MRWFKSLRGFFLKIKRFLSPNRLLGLAWAEYLNKRSHQYGGSVGPFGDMLSREKCYIESSDHLTEMLWKFGEKIGGHVSWAHTGTIFKPNFQTVTSCLVGFLYKFYSRHEGLHRSHNRMIYSAWESLSKSTIKILGSGKGSPSVTIFSSILIFFDISYQFVVICNSFIRLSFHSFIADSGSMVL